MEGPAQQQAEGGRDELQQHSLLGEGMREEEEELEEDVEWREREVVRIWEGCFFVSSMLESLSEAFFSSIVVPAIGLLERGFSSAKEEDSPVMAISMSRSMPRASACARALESRVS